MPLARARLRPIGPVVPCIAIPRGRGSRLAGCTLCGDGGSLAQAAVKPLGRILAPMREHTVQFWSPLAWCMARCPLVPAWPVHFACAPQGPQGRGCGDEDEVEGGCTPGPYQALPFGRGACPVAGCRVLCSCGHACIHGLQSRCLPGGGVSRNGGRSCTHACVHARTLWQRTPRLGKGRRCG